MAGEKKTIFANRFLIASVLIFTAVLFLAGAHYFSILNHRIEVSQSQIIKGVKIKQTSPAIAAGSPVKWTAIVKRSNITKEQNFLLLPKSARNVKIKIISASEAKKIIAQASISARANLTNGDRKVLEESSAPKKFTKLAAAFSLLSDAGEAVGEAVSQAVSQAVSAVTGGDSQVSQTSDATAVNLSPQAPPSDSAPAVSDASGETAGANSSPEAQTGQQEAAGPAESAPVLTAPTSPLSPVEQGQESGQTETQNNGQETITPAAEATDSGVANSSSSPGGEGEEGEQAAEVRNDGQDEVSPSVEVSLSPAGGGGEDSEQKTEAKNAGQETDNRNNEQETEVQGNNQETEIPSLPPSDNLDYVQVDYETPAPKITEKKTKTGKIVIVSDPNETTDASSAATDKEIQGSDDLSSMPAGSGDLFVPPSSIGSGDGEPSLGSDDILSAPSSESPISGGSDDLLSGDLPAEENNQEESAKFTDVLAYTTIPEIYKVGEEGKIKIKWLNEQGQAMPFAARDTDNNGKLDYVEWIVPHLSDQVFEIIFISKAWHLDNNQEILEDIYDQVQTRDGTFATVPQDNYVRVTFQQVLDNTKDITIHMRPNSQSVGNPTIEVYPVYTDEQGNQTHGDLIAVFPIVDREDTYKVLLTSLQTSTDVFDLKIVRGE